MKMTDALNADEEYRHLGGSKGKKFYLFSLLFCAIYSYIVYGLQFVQQEIQYVFIYLTNWTFTLFLFSVTLSLVEELVDPITLSHSLKKAIFGVSLITRPTYIYVCFIYTLGLILHLAGSTVLLAAENNIDGSNEWLFYFNDISKHFVFIVLLIVIFVFSPRSESHAFTYKWWKFTYSLSFILVYLFFALIYYRATDVKIYEVDNVAIILIVCSLPVVIFFIFLGFKMVDDKIRRHLF